MATTANNTSLILNITGAPGVALKRGEKSTVPAKAGQRYRVVKEGEEEASKDVAASQQGQDLLLTYAEGTQVVLVNFYEACKAEQCAVDMPGSKGTGASGGYVITGDSPTGASLSDGGRLVYAFGETSLLAGMTQGAEQARGFTLQDSWSTYIPAHDAQTSWIPMLGVIGGAGAAAVLFQGNKADPVPTVIHGSVVAGPVVAGNGLTAVAYKSDGTVLATGLVKADGTFTLNVGNDYLGAVLVKVSDANANPDYWDEATGAPKDLTSDLRALTVIPAAGTHNISVNVLTELAVRSLGLTGGDTGGSTVNFASVSATQITQANQKVAAAVGLTQDLVLGAAPVAIITTDGTSNAQSNDYGRLLAALSGAEVGSNTSAVLDDLVDKLQSSQAQATGQVLEVLLEGAAKPKINLVAAVSDITNQKSTAITIEAVSLDNRLSPTEMIAGVQVQGTAAAGASVTITWSDSSGTASATGTRTINADSQGQWATSFNSAEMPALGATTLKASVGAIAATRSIYLDEPLAPTIALTQTTGNIANLTRNGHVDVIGLLTGAGWDYSLDNGATWVPGSGSGFMAMGDGAQQVLVRQNISGHYSPASNRLDFELDATAPSITSGNTAALNESASASPVIYTALASDPLLLSYSLKATGDHSLLSINAATGAVTLTGNPDFETKPSYSFTVIATDAAGNASEKAVTLAINNLDEVAPAISSGASATAINENSGAAQVIYTATSTDSGDVATGSTSYSLKATGDQSLLSINAATGAVTLTGNPDFETKLSYSFTVIATDAAGHASEQAVTLAINNLDEVAPAISSGTTATAINENSGAAQVIYTATSTDTGDVATGSTTYSLKATGDASLLSINAATGAVTLTANPNYETQSSYSFTVIATDAANNSSEQAVTLAINNLDEVAPAISSGASATAINENSGAAQVIYTATSTDTGDVATGSTSYSLKATGDASLLSINAATGAVTLTGNPDFETKPSYSFTVVATDAAGHASEQAVTLAINNLDEVAPAISSGATATAINENSGAAQVIYTATSTDTGDVATGSTSYSLKATGDASLLSINAATGAVTLTGNPDFETKPSYSFTVVATDAAGHASEQAVTLAINNLDEVAPAISSGATATAINENSGAAQVIYTATSTDTGDVATGSTTYSLKATGDASLLNINVATGAVTLTANPDFETKSSYSFTVVATDAAGHASEQAVTLAINNLDEVAPTVTISASTTSLSTNAIATLTFTLSEPVASFSDASVTVTGGTLSNFAGSGTSYTATFTPDVGLSGAATVSVGASAVTDAAGNSNSAASNTVSITVDTLAPQVASISASRSSLLVDQTATLTITLSEATTNFGLADLQAVGGTLSNLVGSGASYTATFSPDANRTAPGSVSVTARSFSDAAGNDNQRSENDGVIMAISTQRPSATLHARQNQLGMGDVTTIDITLSEKSSNFVLADLSASHGTLSDFKAQENGIHYSVLFTPDSPFTGQGSVSLADGTFSNAAGNSNLGVGHIAATDSLAIDTTPPTVTITSDKLALAIGQSATITFTFNKDPGDSFDATDITVNGGTLTNLVNHTGTVWSARFTPTDGSTGQASISVAAGNYTDSAANQGAAGIMSTITIDTQGPTADSLLPGNATTVLPGHALVLGFNEVVHKGTGNLVLVNDTAGTRTTLAVSDASVVLAGDGKTLTITPATALVAGSQYHVEASAGTLLDAAGNAWAGIAASSTWTGSNWRFTAATPSVSLNKITADNVVNGAENTAGVLVSGFVESNTVGMVAAFVAGDFTVTLTPQGGGTTINANASSYTPGTGAWSLTLAAGALVDGKTYDISVAVAGSTGLAASATASTTGSVLVDLSATAPTLSLLKDTGSSNSDADTSNAIVSVSGLEAGAAWEYKIDSGTWTTGSGNQFTGASTDAAHTVQVRQTDAAGNVSSNGSLTFTLDTTAAKPVINVVATDNIINATETGSAITGTAETGASVQLVLGTGAQARSVSVTANGSGTWSHTLNAGDLAALAESATGQTQITATQTDVAGNTSYTAQRNLTVDTVAPTVSIEATQTQLNAAAPTSALTFTLSEKSSDFTASSVTVTGGTLSNFAGSGTTYTATFTPTNAATTAASISVAAGAFHDAAGNANGEVSNTVELGVDTLVPTVAVTSNASTLLAGEVATLTFTLSEGSDSFGADSLNVVGGTLSQLMANAARTVYTGVFTPTQGFAGAGSVSVANSAFFDRGGNANADGADTNNTVALTILGAPITLDISSDKSELKASETATLTFAFSSAPTGFAAADITVTGGTLGALTTVDSTHYTAVFTPAASTASGTASVSVAAGSYTGAGGAVGEGAKVAEITLDTLAPTLSTLNPEDNGYLAAGNALVATFSETVFVGTGSIRLVDDTAGTTVTFAIDDSAIAISGSQLTLTPSTALVSGHNYHLSIDSTALVDAAGNAYVGIANATSWNFGATNLSTTLNPVTGDNRINGDEKTAGSIVLGGTVSSLNSAVLGGLLASDIVVKVTVPRNGGWNDSTDKIITCTGVTYDSTTGEWTATLPETWIYDGFTSNTTTSTLINDDTDTIRVTITGRTGTAAAGLSATLTDTMTVDLSDPATPTLTLASDTGSSNSDGITRNGLINVGALEAGGTWQYSLDNGSNWQPGTGTSLAIPQDGATSLQVKQADAAGNESATRSLAVTLDTQASAPVVDAIATDNRINLAEATSAITGTADANASVSLVVGTNTRTVTANSSGVWSYTLVAGDLSNIGQGNKVISVTQTDKAGNISAATKAVIDVDTARPTVTLANTGSASLLAGQSTTVTATLSELVANFSADSLTVSGGALSGLQVDSTGLIHTGTFTPDADSTTAGSIQLAAGAVADAAGNTNAAASAALALTINTVRPTVAITSNVIAGTALHAGDTATVTFTLSQSSSDFTVADVSTVGGSLSNFAGSGSVYTATFTPDANSRAPGSVSVTNGTFANAASNANADAADTNNTVGFVIATARPTLSISSDLGTLGGSQTALITFTFSEDPGSSFSWDGSSGDITLTGGTLSALKGVGTVYTAVFTPTAGFAGAAGISVADGLYTNADASLGQAGGSPALTIDAVAPTVAISRSGSGPLGVGQTDTITFDFSEAPGSSFTLEDIDVSGGTLGALSAVSATRYVATFTPEANASGTANLRVANGRFSDAAGNTNADGADANNLLAIGYATGNSNSGGVTSASAPSLSLSADTGVSSSDGITNNGVIEVSALMAGATWEYSLNGGSNWLAGSGSSFTLPSAGVYTVATGSLQVHVRQSAGGATSSVGTLAADVDYRPAYSSNVSVALDMDTGSSATDAITYRGAPMVTGLAATDTWRYSIDNGLNWVTGTPTTWTSGGQLQSANIISTGQAAGQDKEYKVLMEATDLAGNTRTVKYGFRQDNVAPAAPNIQLTADLNDGGAIVAASNIEPGATVTYKLMSGTTTVSTGTSYTQPTALGNYSLFVSQTDVAGNISTPTTLAFSVLAPVTGIQLSALAAGVGGFEINGQSQDDNSGISVSGAGDVNGDGLADLIVGASSAIAAGYFSGRSYVVYGKTSTSSIDLSTVAAGTGGFVINGQCASDYSGISVSSAGDLNGDGLADLIVGARYGDTAVSKDAGRSYVVYGKTSGGFVDLSAVATGSGGFVINGQCASDNSGFSVSSAGDVNGDGLADLIVGAFMSDPATGADAGRSYVVYGETSGGKVDLSAIAAGSGGFVINGQCASDFSGTSVSSAGDVNGDGLADLIVGAVNGDPARLSDAGRSYVVFGKTSGGSVDLSDVATGTGSGGFVINGQCASDYSGFSVSSAGDVNGDGLADLIVGATQASPFNGGAGRSYVVFGKTATGAIDLSGVAAGLGGFVINGQCKNDLSGYSVSSAGDFNGDGLADLIVGAKYGDTAVTRDAGRSYVVFGKTSGSSVDLSAVAAKLGGFVIDGQGVFEQSGGSVSSAGDVNGDGLADLVVGAFSSRPAAGRAAGRSYVIFGSTSGIAGTGTLVDQMGTDGADTQSDNGTASTLVAGAGDDNLTATAASVLYGGAGNDLFTIDQAMITALRTPMGEGGNVNRLARIDGGNGIDTLALSGSGLTLDLTQIANQAGANPDGGSRIDSVEVIDLTGTGNNTLLLAALDVQDMAGMNLFNSGNGWTGLAASVARHQLRVEGNTGDALKLGEEWSRGSTATYGGVSYVLYNAGTSAQVLVHEAVTVDLPPQVVNLSAVVAGVGGFVINGQCRFDQSGISVSSAGDVNGDGLADLIVGAYVSNPASGVGAGRSYVVFGKTSASAINLSAVAVGTGGFVINGQCQFDQSGYSVSSAGDVNGDGLADLIVGANTSDPASGTDAGRSYVVFGRTGGTAIDLSAVAAGTGGFVINGQSREDKSGSSVSSAGDVNGDGLADLIVGAYNSDPASGADAGRSYVVFGKTSGSAINLAVVAAGKAGGFVINGQCAGDLSGTSVSSAGDVNGDGLADLILGATTSDPASGVNAGRSYVVFGKNNGSAINLSAVAAGNGGFVINGQCAGDQSGISVSSAGDVNGDGLADLILGATTSDPASGESAGRSYVVFGKTSGSAINLSAVAAGNGGFVINGQCEGYQFGMSVSSAGDVNGDGLADLIVGANTSDPASGVDAGRSYVVFGKTRGTAINLSDVAAGVGGFVINGQCAIDLSGSSVSSAGDVNGDGLADLIVGARYSDPDSGGNAGRSYVIFGSITGAFAQTAVDWLGTDAADTQSDGGLSKTLVGGAGDDALTATAASVLYGGAGNDLLTIDIAMIAALRTPMGVGGNVNRLARIDGGSGIDTLALSGSGLTLDLTRIANQAGANPDGGSRIDSVEVIDLTGTGNNSLVLAALDVQDMAGMNLFNSGNGWTGLAASVERHQLRVEGNTGDLLKLGKEWTLGGTATNGGVSYKLYNAGSGAQVLVNAAVKVDLPSQVINLVAVAAGEGGFIINGRGAIDSSGISVSSAGDVNGDGLADLIVGANVSDLTSGANANRSYVVFGKTGGTAINLSAVTVGSGGFVINGQCAGDQSGISVSSAGDVNGDGLADLIVGARDSDPASGANAGRSYVVFGKSNGTAIDLSAVAAGTGGFVINGQCAGDYSGNSVSSAGDVNGDGLADLIVGAFYSDPDSGSNAGRSYVVFGKPSGTAINLSAVWAGAGGFVINGQCADDVSGYSVSSAGDVNGDGLADLIVGAFNSDPAIGADAGRSYVVFGKTSGTAINLSAVAGGAGGFVINGQCAGDVSGYSVSSAGDVNGDGLADLIVGARESDPASRNSAGRSYVVFGKGSGSAINLSAVAGGTGGFVINGQCASDQSGISVASAGDVNGDGLADLIVGANTSDPASGANAGRSYVVFGKNNGTAINLSDVAAGNGGFVINGQCAGDQSGSSVSSAGDVNGDGLADLIVGANFSSPAGATSAGRSYVIFGSNSGAFMQTAVDWIGTDGVDTCSDNGAASTLVAGAGDDALTATAASVLYGGVGNDSFTIDQAMITALQSPMGAGGNVDQLARIDGGGGKDKIVLSGAGLTFDLTQVANQAASNPDGGSRIDSVEIFDITGTGNNTLKLTSKDVLELGSAQLFTTTAQRQQLLVMGNAGDTVDLFDGAGTTGWTKAESNASIETVNYEVWNHNTNWATLYVQSGMAVI